LIGVLVFLVGVYGTTWVLSLLLRAPAGAGSSAAILTFFFGTVWAPTIIALLVVQFVERKPCTEFLRERFPKPRPGGWFAAAVVVPALTIIVAMFISRALGHAASFTALSSWPSIIAFRIATGATGEELGWRGFLVSRLASRFGFATAALASGVLWSAWHLAGVVFPGSGLDVVPLAPFLLFAALFGIFLAFVFTRTGGNVLATMLAHLSLNVTLAAGGTPLDSRPFWWILVLGIAVSIGIAALKLPANER
jgi:CAAX protease family protein